MDQDNPSSVLIDPMLALAEIWSAKAGKPLTVLAERVISSSQFFARVREGRDITVRNYARVTAWLSEPANWPDERMPKAAKRIVEIMPHGADIASALAAASSHKADECMSDSDLGAAA
ncbi:MULTISPECIES: hypothetical protein [unclassified Sphingobium]|uniref:hypothetical protein n=1 Tax=unclassified Sphingobium TaxID=2611147 RepID=UPI00077067F1|nr:hypothetical protein [Sphingobium sp. MI1205]AMK18728.1 hypothetical protein K663_11745 [Sphingobium sp. MI1205]